MRYKPIQHKLDGLFVLLLFAIFACSILMVLLGGANSYQRLADRDADSYTTRTCLQYIAAKLRHGDQVGAIKVSSFSDANRVDADEISTLYIYNRIDGEDYATRIYWYDGAVRELFASAEGEFMPEDGNLVLETAGLSFSWDSGLLKVTTLNEEGLEHSLLLGLHSEGRTAT